MLLELLTLFENLALRIATVCSAGTQTNVHNILRPSVKNVPKSVVDYKIQILNCDLRKGQASKP